MPEKLNKIIKIRNLIENKNFRDAKDLLRSPLVDEELKKLFKFHIAVVEKKTIPKDVLKDYLTYKDNSIGEIIHSLAGDYYFLKNRFGNAISHYHNCLEINPSNIHVMFGIANSLQSLGYNKLSEKKYLELMPYYTWKKDLYSQNSKMDNDLKIKNKKKIIFEDFEFIPRDMLLNIALVYDSINSKNTINPKDIFDYIIKTSIDDNFPKSYIFLEENYQLDQNDSEIKLSKTGFIEKIQKLFPDFYKKYQDDILQGKYSQKQNEQKLVCVSKEYEIKCIIYRESKIYSYIPKTIPTNEKIISIFSMYLKNLDASILDDLLNILKINYNPQFKNKEFLLEYWLKSIKNKKSITYIKKSKIQKLSKINENYKNKFIRDIISNRLTIKAINEQWPMIDEKSILNQFKGPKNNYLIAKSLVDSLADYNIFLNSKKEYRLKNYLKFSEMVENLMKELEQITIDLTKSDDRKKLNQKKKKKLRSQQKNFKELLVRLDFNRNNFTTSKMQKKYAQYD